MIRKIQIPINGKVFSERDVLGFAEKLYERYGLDSESKKLSLELKILDGTGYELEDASPAELAQILQTKKVCAVNFDYYAFGTNSNISLRLDENLSWRNNISIQSADNGWFSWVESAMNELLRDIKPQKNFITRNKKILFHIACLYIGYLITQAIGLAFPNTKPIDNPPGWLAAIDTFATNYKVPFWLLSNYIIGLPWALGLYWKLDSIWPPIEFDFGPEHMKKSKIRRAASWAMLTVFVVPLLLQIIF